MYLLILALFTNIAMADCSSAYRRQDLEMLKNGSSPPALFKCVGGGCICVDKCSDTVNTDSVKMCDIVGLELIANAQKKAQKEENDSQKKRERQALVSKIQAYLARLSKGEDLSSSELSDLKRNEIKLEE